MSEIGLEHYLLLAALLFSLGLYGVLTRRNGVALLMSLELMFNAVNLNLVAFSNFTSGLTGVVFAVFIIAVAAAEATVGVAIVLSVYRNRSCIDTEDISTLKG